MEIAARFEHKFLIDDARRSELLARFADRLRPDTAGGADGRYPVVSLYCDTPDRRCHWEAWRGVPSRRKLRVRLYGTRDGLIPPATFVEVKHRDGREGAKRRVPLPTAAALAVVGGAEVTSPDPADERILAEIRAMVARDGFAPACVIRYDRVAYRYCDPRGAELLRVTFDQRIVARFDRLTPTAEDDGCDRAVLPAGTAVMEVKGSTAVPYELAAWLGAAGLHPRPFSKYSACTNLPAETPARLS
ncbi:MAG: polyphosphate polymerase domain-containing protein [Verrucomicrobia bacterium]|nr:polyphosphate polymerase domain-containing protein [Verrucomicrobiota bacterium]